MRFSPIFADLRSAARPARSLLKRKSIQAESEEFNEDREKNCAHAELS